MVFSVEKRSDCFLPTVNFTSLYTDLEAGRDTIKVWHQESDAGRILGWIAADTSVIIDDDAYAFLLPYLALTPEYAPQRKYPLREVLKALLWVSRTGSQWAFLPHDFPPAEVMRSQAQRWFEAHCFENAVHDLRLFSRVHQQRDSEPSAIILDSRTLQSTPASGHRAGLDGAK